jgi:hypothetical protein
VLLAEKYFPRLRVRRHRPLLLERLLHHCPSALHRRPRFDRVVPVFQIWKVFELLPANCGRAAMDKSPCRRSKTPPPGTASHRRAGRYHTIDTLGLVGISVDRVLYFLRRIPPKISACPRASDSRLLSETSAIRLPRSVPRRSCGMISTRPFRRGIAASRRIRRLHSAYRPDPHDRPSQQCACSD